MLFYFFRFFSFDAQAVLPLLVVSRTRSVFTENGFRRDRRILLYRGYYSQGPRRFTTDDIVLPHAPSSHHHSQNVRRRRTGEKPLWLAVVALASFEFRHLRRGETSLDVIDACVRVQTTGKTTRIEYVLIYFFLLRTYTYCSRQYFTLHLETKWNALETVYLPCVIHCLVYADGNTNERTCTWITSRSSALLHVHIIIFYILRELESSTRSI